MGTLVKFSTMFSLLILAAFVGVPKFVVPNPPDLTVKTQRISGDGTSQLSALYLKGARQRTETVSENPARAHAMNWTVIRQCDEKRLFNINERDKLYSSSEIEDWAERSKKARPVSLSRMSGAEVTVTIDSIDTGERRQFAHYTARRVKATTRFEPGLGASTPASVEETDGWYIDLPGLGCQDRGQLALLSLPPAPAWIGFNLSGSARHPKDIQSKKLRSELRRERKPSAR